MESPLVNIKSGVLLGGFLIAIGIGGGIFLNNETLAAIGFVGILLVILSLGIFGFILPLLD